MDDENAHPAPEPRTPTLDDLLLLCRSLNQVGAQYIVIGGWAVIHHGFGRTTGDVDLLVDTSRPWRLLIFLALLLPVPIISVTRGRFVVARV